MINRLKKCQFFWNISGLLANYYPLVFLKRLPKEIAIEVTNNCNLRCPICPTNFAMSRERGLMNFALYKSIIDEFRNLHEKPKITFIFAGEPLLHPQIDEFIAYADHHGHDTFLSTNATLLSEELAKKIIMSGLKSIHLCLDGATKESHEAYRLGSDFTVVKRNIENFLRIRRELNSINPHTCIQTLLTSFSEDEIDQVSDWARLIGADDIQFKSLSMGSVTSKERREQYKYLLPLNKNYLRNKSKIKKTVCTIPLIQAVVCWNGNLGLCCIDVNTDIKLPNIESMGFLKQYSSLNTRRIRKRAFCKDYQLCQGCSLSQSDFMGWHVEIDKTAPPIK